MAPAGEVARPSAPPRKSRVKSVSRAELEAIGRTLVWVRPASEAPPEPVHVASRRLHIVMVGWEYPPHISGGLGVHCYELCKELTRMGHRVTFVTPFSGPFLETPGVTFRFPGSAPREGTPPPGSYNVVLGPEGQVADSLASYNDWVAALPLAKDVDAIHVHDWFGTVGAASAARRHHVPLVMTVHSTEYDRSLGFPNLAILEMERHGVAAAHRVISVSGHLKKQLIERFHVPPDRIRVVYNAVRPTARLERLVRPDPIVLYLGRLAAMKGVDTFLRAAARVLPFVPDATFVVAGDGPEFPRLLTLAAHLGIADHVLFLGWVTDDERTILLGRASVYVLPSVVEPFGISALEAMVAGVPTIVSKTSGVAEITESVFAVDFWDIDEFASRIAELLTYPSLRNVMSDAVREAALNATWAERARQTVSVYLEVVAPVAAER
ncbi:MAG: glycosyltransferase family 4 protein [Thermoplasmata archaeon]|nr:glycosyltransferase family 4 protein [Thermoplasmata archaeon]